MVLWNYLLFSAICRHQHDAPRPKRTALRKLIYQFKSFYIFLVLVPHKDGSNTTVHRVISQSLEGPYRFEEDPCYRIPVDPTRYAIYALRVHNAFRSCIDKPIEAIFSYIYQPSYPIGSNEFFGNDSAYKIYFPQIVILYESS